MCPAGLGLGLNSALQCGGGVGGYMLDESGWAGSRSGQQEPTSHAMQGPPRRVSSDRNQRRAGEREDEPDIGVLGRRLPTTKWSRQEQAREKRERGGEG